jgi:hypothetical protein
MSYVQAIRDLGGMSADTDEHVPTKIVSKPQGFRRT